ncbi:PrsW family intramembrane metalloprotease [Nostocoides sp.]|uniref:PrsW family intramembrane metalloprotease n=1 Tax=Nostocoides sp. TaxID=1917966 RepID=UPI002CC0F981|nr:PrsW family intramembrane metalloprotease [Tetrasphaera sp.]
MSWQHSPSSAAASLAPNATPPASYDPGYQPRPPAGSSRRAIRGWLVSGLVIAGFAIPALALAAYFQASLGVVTVLLALLLAAIPLGIVVPTFLWLDRFEAEPTRYLVVAFLWGALVSAVLAALFNTGAMLVIEAASDPTSAMAATAVLVAPVVEETLKGLIVVLIWWRRRREFDGLTDGLVYAGITAAGFAFTENIQYLGQAYAAGGGELLAATFVGRGVMSPFAHPMFTCLTGIGIGIAATTRSRGVRIVAPLVGWLLAMLAHGLWNLSAVTGGAGLLVGYFIIGVPIFIGFLSLVVWARRREGRLIGRHLSPYADAGWLSPSEVVMLSSMGHRREARVWAKTNSGSAGLRAMREFQDAASELGLLRQRMYHQAADAQALESERQLLDNLTGARRTFIGGGT